MTECNLELLERKERAGKVEGESEPYAMNAQ